MANKVNLGNAIISNNPGTGGTTFEVSGYGDVMPVANFYATATPAGQLSTMGNSEIVLVTAKSTDNLTVTRAQKGTTAQDVDAGWILSNGVYVEDLDEKADESDLTAHTSNTSNPHSVTKAQVGLGNVTNDAQLKIASNLSDLDNTTTARTNLGLGSLAIKSSVDIADINATGGTSTSFLRKDGTWQTPTNTTYAEITTAEIDAGTASTLRTITGRRAQYIVDKVLAAVAAITDIVRRTDTSISGAGWLQNSVSSATDKAVTPNAAKDYVDNNKVLAETSYITTDETQPSTGFQDLATPGPSLTVTVPPSGKVEVSISCGSYGNSNPKYIGIELSGANTSSPAARSGQEIRNDSSLALIMGISFVMTGLTPGSTTFKMKYSGPTTSKYFDRRLNVKTLP